MISINIALSQLGMIMAGFIQRGMTMGCCGQCGGEGHEQEAEQAQTEESVETTEEE